MMNMHTMNSSATVVVMAFAIGLGGVSSVKGDEVTLGPAKDNTLFSTGAFSNGIGDAVFSGRTGFFANFIRQRAVLAFDVASGVPDGATITGVTLTMTLVRAGNDGEELHTLHRAQSDWGEGTTAAFGGTGAPATPGDATWLHTFFPDQFWTNEGGDFEALASSSTMVGDAPVQYSWDSTPDLVADVQSWLDDPASNFGWVMVGDEVNDRTSRKFASREHADAAMRPMLRVEYVLSAPCTGDLNGDGIVDVHDLLQVVHSLRTIGDVPEDLDGDGKVTPRDMHIVIRNFGPCPE